MSIEPLSVLCVLQGSQQGPSAQVTIQQSAGVAQSVRLGEMRAYTVSTTNLLPSSSHVIALGIVTKASCVKMESVLELINTISTNGTNQFLTYNKI